MNHSFDVDVATEYGIEEAILINHFEFWIAKNKANKTNIHDGRYWTYNSVSAFEELFPYISKKKIRTTLDSLREKGLILTGNYNTSAYDRTLWYSLSDLASCILLKGQIDLPQWANGIDPEGTPIPVTNTVTNTVTVVASAVIDKGLEFNQFWLMYPRKVKKPDALRAWKKVKPFEYENIFKSLPVFIDSEQWKKQDKIFVPYPATWLNNQCWNDDLPDVCQLTGPKKLAGGGYE